jgi:membrane-anchored protein YejM (alkaline phosphatase superfamily)
VFSQNPGDTAKNVANLQTLLYFWSDYRWGKEIPCSRNNWIFYDFKARRVVQTHGTIKSLYGEPARSRFKAWVVE